MFDEKFNFASARNATTTDRAATWNLPWGDCILAVYLSLVIAVGCFQLANVAETDAHDQSFSRTAYNTIQIHALIIYNPAGEFAQSNLRCSV